MLGDVERVMIGLIDLGEGFDQIDCVGFVAAEPGANRMSVNRDAHRSVSEDTLLLAFSGLATATHGRSPGDVRVLTRVALANTGSLAAQVAQVIELRAANASLLHHVDVIDNRGVQRKNSFDADAKAGLAHGNRFARAAVFARNTDTFKSLQTLFGFRFLDAHVHAHGVTRLK